MADAVHADMLNLMEALPKRATEAQKRELMGKLNDMIRGNPVHEALKSWEKALRTTFGNDYHLTADIVVLGVFMDKYKNLLKSLKEEDAPNDVEMAMGGRKRRAKKTKSKSKKNRRYTRRR